MINLLHLFYGAGGIIAPYFVTLVLKLGFSWNYSFLFSIVTWLAPFLKDVQGRTDLIVSFYFSLFFITFTLGRFMASIIVEKIGYYNFLIITGAVAASLISSALIGGYKFTILIPISGLFLAGQVPTLQAAILDSFDSSVIKVVGFAQTAGMVGLTVLSDWVVGFINDFVAIEAGFIFLVIILAAAMIITYYLKRIIQHETAV